MLRYLFGSLKASLTFFLILCECECFSKLLPTLSGNIFTKRGVNSWHARLSTTIEFQMKSIEINNCHDITIKKNQGNFN